VDVFSSWAGRFTGQRNLTPLLGIEAHFLRRHPHTLYRLSLAEVFFLFFFFFLVLPGMYLFATIARLFLFLLKKTLFVFDKCE
jgi:hypothetical protein